MKKEYRVYNYRWFLLAVFMFLNIVIQIQWLSHAMIARPATIFFESRGVEFTSFYNIDTLAILYMLVYIVVCLPASYIIDRFNLRMGIGIGAVLSAVGALMKGFFASSFSVVFFGQVLLAIGQPFVLNAATRNGDGSAGLRIDYCSCLFAFPSVDEKCPGSSSRCRCGS